MKFTQSVIVAALLGQLDIADVKAIQLKSQFVGETEMSTLEKAEEKEREDNT